MALGHFSWLQFIPGVGHHYLHVASVILVSIVMVGLGLLVKKQMQANQRVQNNPPCKSFSPLGFFEGHAGVYLPAIRCHHWQSWSAICAVFHAFYFCSFFSTIFLGLLPGLTPATDNLNTTFCNRSDFLCTPTMYLGVKEQGPVNYIKHFMGPIWWIAPLLFAIESDLVTSFVLLPLGLRLMGNMTGDHTVLGAFLELVPIGVPVIFYCLGAFCLFCTGFGFHICYPWCMSLWL